MPVRDSVEIPAQISDQGENVVLLIILA